MGAMLSSISTDERPESAFPLYLSPSQISSLLTCGYQFYLTRGLHASERPMWAGIGGSAVHRVTEALDRAAWEGQQ